jgi:hypothetical protein
MSNPTTPLIELRHHYQNIIAQSEYQATQAKAQIEHIDALLVNGLIQVQEPAVLKADIVLNVPALAAAPTVELESETKTSSPDFTQPAPQKPALKTRVTKAKPQAKTDKSQAKVASSGRESFPLLPAYQGMTKLEAISQILSEQSGHVLHQDTIIQLLYGDLSPEVLKVESRRMRASLFQGVTKGLWQRALKQPSSYVVKTGKVQNKSKTTEGESVAPKVRSAKALQPEAKQAETNSSKTTVSVPPSKAGRKTKTTTTANTVTPKKSSSRGREQVLPLPAEYTGLSKIDTVAKVLEENKGKVMHMDDIIEQLYGKLSESDLKAEKVRMKDVMTRGVKRNLWRKAEGVPSSIIAAGAKSPIEKDLKTSTKNKTDAPGKRPGRKPKASNNSEKENNTPKKTTQRRRRSSAGG